MDIVVDEYKFVIPIYGVYSSGVLSMNKYRNASYRENNRAKKKFKKLIESQFLFLKPINCQVNISYKLYPKRMDCDLDNVVSVVKKFFNDSLVDFGILLDDSVKFITGNSEEFAGLDISNPRVEAEIFFVDV